MLEITDPVMIYNNNNNLKKLGGDVLEYELLDVCVRFDTEQRAALVPNMDVFKKILTEEFSSEFPQNRHTHTHIH